jgi:hypothetical protein
MGTLHIQTNTQVVIYTTDQPTTDGVGVPIAHSLHSIKLLEQLTELNFTYVYPFLAKIFKGYR